VYLDKWEEKALNGEYGEAVQLAMRLIVKVGEALGAERLLRISHAHVSGISYDNIGEAGLEFIKSLYEMGGRARVFSTFNPVGVSIGVDSFLNRDRVLVKKQEEIIRYLIGMGFKFSATCIPYMIREPRQGEHLAWGESSAVVVANSVYGARTNREGGPIALAAALTGRIYEWGLHLSENRKPSIYVKYEGSPLDEPYSGLLGYLVGLNNPSTIPYIDARFGSRRGVLSFAAASAAAGNLAMTIIRGVSPEDEGPPKYTEDKVVYDFNDLLKLKKDLENAGTEEVEAFFTGCPHHSVDVIGYIEDVFIRMGLRKVSKPIWVSVPAMTVDRGVVERLRSRNVVVLPGTCPVVSRMRDIVKAIATDSLKTVFYLPRRHGISVRIMSLKEFIEYYGEK
jgi:hypothetical protein